MPTLRQFRYLDALDQERHFGRAAETCAVSQPALSMQIQELERELDLSLVERRRGRVALTPHGNEVLRLARRALETVEDIRRFADASRGLAGNLTLGVIPTIGPYLLPDLLPAVRAAFPSLRLGIRESRTATLSHELSAGRLDMMIVALPVPVSEFDALTLATDRFLLATPASKPAPADRERLVEFIASEQLLLLEEGNCLRDQALRHCDVAGVRYGEVYGTSNISTLVQMVANGLGITLVPELCLRQRGLLEEVRLTRFTEPQPHRVIALAWRKTSPGAERFAEFGALVSDILAGRAQRT